MRVATVVLIVLTTTGNAAAAVGTGLEVPPGTKLDVIVEKLDVDGWQSGLSEELIRKSVIQRLSEYRIEVNSEEDTKAKPSDVQLHVDINTSGKSFSLRIELRRKVYYQVGDKTLEVIAPTYSESGVGQAGSEGRYALAWLLDLIDQLSFSYLQANNVPLR